MDASVATLAVGIAVGVIVVLLCLVALAPAYIRRVRENAILQSRAITRGQIFEQLVPYFPEFRFNPKDAQFLGKPVDFVVFDGLDEGEVRRIVFVEVKTGVSTLTTRERRVRDAIRRGCVEWREIRVAGASAIRDAERPALR